MTTQQRRVSRELALAAQSLFRRDYSFGTAGNLSARIDDCVVVSPTNCSFEDLEEGDFAIVSLKGELLNQQRPSKEAHFHLAIYEARKEARAVVHLHSTYATAVSCLPTVPNEEVLPIYTPYFAMRIPALPVVPYLRPGHPGLAEEVRYAASLSPAMLLKNHGSITTGKTIREATALAEELEQQAKLFFLLSGRGETLNASQIAELRGGKAKA